MSRVANLLACLAAVGLWLLAVPVFAGEIYVYQDAKGARLITDHPRVEAGYRLVRVYPQSGNPVAAADAPRASFTPAPSRFDALIHNMARRNNVDPMLIKSVMHAESAFNPNAVSSKGASGLMQLMPATAARFGVSRIFNPRENVSGGTRYLSLLLERFDGNLELALAGYNAGENAVDRAGGLPPYPETRHYVKKVLGLYKRYRNGTCRRQLANADSFQGRIISCSASTRAKPARVEAASVTVSSTMTAASGNEHSQGGWRMD